MRISKNHINLIKTLAYKFFGKNARIYLFGSRADDKKKGGDIDIYIETDIEKNILDRKINMLIALENRIGQRKIDLIINNHHHHLQIYDIAKEEGIQL